jgi:hypothetical protein
MEYEPRLSNPNLIERVKSLSNEDRVFFTQLGLLLSYQMADTLTTYVAYVTNSGQESFAASSYLYEHYGFGVYMLLKLGAMASMAASLKVAEGMEAKYINKFGDTISNGTNMGMTAMNLYFAAICINNVGVILGKMSR